MSGLRSLLPRPGNAVRPVFFLVLVLFALMLVGFPILTIAVGLGTGTVLLAIGIILPVAIGTLWFLSQLGRTLDREEQRLDAGDVWAEWTISEREHRSFVATQRRDTIRRAVFFALTGAAMGLGFWIFAADTLTAWVMVSVFLLAAVVTLFTGPPRSAHDDNARQVRIGPTGVRSLGRYQPFRTTGSRLRRIDFEPGDPSIIRFSVRSGRRSAYNTVEIPVAADHQHDAEAVVERVRQAHGL